MSDPAAADGSSVRQSATFKELQASLLDTSKQAQAEWQARVQAESRLEALEARVSGLGYQLDQEREKVQGLEAELEELKAEKAILTEELQAAEQLSAFHAERAQQQLEDMRERLQAAEEQLSAQHEAREHPGGLRGKGGVSQLVQHHSALTGRADADLADQLELLKDKLQDSLTQNINLANQLDQERQTTSALQACLDALEGQLKQRQQQSTPSSPDSQTLDSQLLQSLTDTIHAAKTSTTAGKVTTQGADDPSNTLLTEDAQAHDTHAPTAITGTVSDAEEPRDDSKPMVANPSMTSSQLLSAVSPNESESVTASLRGPSSPATQPPSGLEHRVNLAVQVLAKLWSKYGDNPWHRGIVKGIAEAVQLLADSSAQDAAGRTALHVAAARGQADIVAVLLQGGAKLEAADVTGRTPLHAAAEKGHVDAVKALLRAGAGLEARNNGGDTALHSAAGYGQERVVKELLSAGADPRVRDEEGRSALQKALLWGYAGTAITLLQGIMEMKQKEQPTRPAAVQTHLTPTKTKPFDPTALEVEWLPAQKLLEEQADELLAQLRTAPAGEEGNKVDMERVLAVQAQVYATLHERASPLVARCNEEALIAVLSPGLGFHRGRPIAAVLLFRCCAKWNIFQAESTTFFQRALLKIGSQLDDSMQLQSSTPSTGQHAGHDATLGYWLANAAALLAGLRTMLRPVEGPAGGEGGGRASNPGAALLAAVRSHWNALKDLPLPLQLQRGGLGGRARGKQQQEGDSPAKQTAADVPHIPAHLPALVFKRQLDALIIKTFSTLRDNAKARLSTLLPACTHHDRSATLQGASESSSTTSSSPAGWAQVVSSLGELLKTADSNCLPPTIVGELFHQLLVFLDTNLFNQLLLRRECCSFSNARFLAEGLAQVDSWFASIGREVLGAAPQDLIHIRQAVHFLMLSSKSKQSLQHIHDEVCPALTLSQVYVLCTKFFDDEHGTGGVGPEVLGEMQAQLAVEEEDVSRSFLLDDGAANASAAVSALLQTLPVQDLLSGIPVPESLLKGSAVAGAFAFLEQDWSAEE